MNETANLFDAAANLIAVVGKATGRPRGKDDSVCAIQAIAECIGWGDQDFVWHINRTVTAAERILAPQYNLILNEDRPLAQWSDAHTKDEVVAGLRSAAAILRAQESKPVAVAESVPA